MAKAVEVKGKREITTDQYVHCSAFKENQLCPRFLADI